MNTKVRKYKAWNEISKSWINSFMIDCDGCFYPQDSYGNYDWNIDCLKVKIIEFTGLEDALFDGEEIYENDIIRNVDTGYLEIVYWNEQEAAWWCKYHNADRIISLADSLRNLNKKVGNVFDNPELLQNE